MKQPSRRLSVIVVLLLAAAGAIQADESAEGTGVKAAVASRTKESLKEARSRLRQDHYYAGGSEFASNDEEERHRSTPTAAKPVGTGIRRALLIETAVSTDLKTAGEPPLPPISEEIVGPCDEQSCCPTCQPCDCCPQPVWVHRSGAFADVLYLRPGNIDYIYAVEQSGTQPTDSPTVPVGRVGFDAALGYRAGLTHALSDCSSLQASYTWFQDDTQNTINATAGNVLVFQPGDPSVPNVGASSIQASSNYDIRFQNVDVDYRGLLWGSGNGAVNYFGGVRYANLKQNFLAQEDVGAPVGLTTVRTHLAFDGFGIGMGLDGMRRSDYCGLLVYGRGSASFVAGEFKATYRQENQFGPNSVVGNNLVDYRVLTILQTELGLGWQSYCGRLRLTTGYQFTGWQNALTTGSYILGVQRRQFNDLNETITFNGLVARVAWQF